MKSIICSLAILVCVLAKPCASGQTIFVDGFFPRDTNGPAQIKLVAEQLADFKVDVQASLDMTWSNPFTAATWACYPFHQFVAAWINAEIYGAAFYQSLNTPCPAALGAVEIEPHYPLNDCEKAYRWTDPRPDSETFGVTFRIAFRLPSVYEQTFPYREAVRRYVLEPDSP